MNSYSQVTAALTSLLTRENDDAFVIIQERQTQKFVQFTGSKTDSLMLDLPSQTLSELEFRKAAQLFEQMGVAGTESPVFDEPGGRVVGEQFTFNKVCNSATEAANLVQKIFTIVYGFPLNCEIEIIEN